MRQIPVSEQSVALDWRHVLLVLGAAGPFIALLIAGPIMQESSYHRFADDRAFLGITNFGNVVSNLPFLIVGGMGVWSCLRRDVGPARDGWLVFFLGVGMVAFGSAYYHLSPTSETLVWDRLPMTIGFMSLLAALLTEFVSGKVGPRLLFPLVVLGIGSVAYWNWFGDLRLYVWVQFTPLLLLPVIVLFFRSPYKRQRLLLVAVGFYLVAKIAEMFDAPVLQTTRGLLSGHSLKHLFAAAACAAVLVMLATRSTAPRARKLQPSPDVRAAG